MRPLVDVPHALAALVSSLSMGPVTTVHHLHAMRWVDPSGPGAHVVFNELVILPITLASMLVFVRTGNRFARGVFLIIAALGFAGLALYEGGWNHTLGILARLRLDGPSADIRTVLPAGQPHRWFHEISGVLTFAVALIATYHGARFGLATRSVPAAGRPPQPPSGHA